MKKPVFTGSCTAMVTPYSRKDGSVDYEKMDQLLLRQIQGGTAAVVICGTTGENATQPIAEHNKLVEHCVDFVNGRIKVIAGVGSNDSNSALGMAQNAKACGADGILMVTPYYNKSTQRGLVAHFSYVADAVDIPMILYNVPSRTSVGISLETYIKLAEHPNINGVKEASGDMSLFALTRAHCGDSLHIWSGNDDNTVPMLALGAKGVISTCSNLIPEAMADLCKAGLQGDFQTASAIYFKYAELMRMLFVETNPIPVKTALNLMGLDAGVFRLPLVDMTEGNLEKLKKAMADVGLLAH